MLKDLMNYTNKLPSIIPIFPLSNFIFFPKTSVPINVFEPRYLKMVDDSMKGNKIIGMIQPRKNTNNSAPDLYSVGCAGKITSYNETDDGRYLIILNGINRFKVLNEIKNDKIYRECKVSFEDYLIDASLEKTKINNLKEVFKNLKYLFKKKGYIVNWNDIEKQNIDQIINALAMSSPFTLEEKQALLEVVDINSRKLELEKILNTYVIDDFKNNTIQ